MVKKIAIAGLTTLLLAVLVFWYRCPNRFEYVALGLTDHWSIDASSIDQRIEVGVSWSSFQRRRFRARSQVTDGAIVGFFPTTIGWGRGLFSGGAGGGETRTWSCWFPFWLAASVNLLLLSGLLFYGAWLKRRRAKHGLCLECGYNLTGNVTGVCSECGHPRSYRYAEPIQEKDGTASGY